MEPGKVWCEKQPQIRNCVSLRGGDGDRGEKDGIGVWKAQGGGGGERRKRKRGKKESKVLAIN